MDYPMPHVAHALGILGRFSRPANKRKKSAARTAMMAMTVNPEFGS
jgi:hypothetical protein